MAQCTASPLPPCPLLHPVTTQFNTAPLLCGESMGRITRCENVSLPRLGPLCWCWHLAWYQRGVRYSASHQSKHMMPLYMECERCWSTDTDPVSYFFIVINPFHCTTKKPDMFFLLQHSISGLCYRLHHNYTGCCLLETTFPSLHLLHLTSPFSSFLYPSSSPPPRPPTTLSPRWPWGRPVWNVIGIIPFSLIASAGEQPYVSHRVPTEPL